MQFLIVPHPNNSKRHANMILGGFHDTEKECLEMIKSYLDELDHRDIFHIMDFESSTFSDFQVRKDSRLVPINE